MKRLVPILAICAIALVAIGATTVAAWHVSPAFLARATDAEAGERMRVVARVDRPDWSASFSADAVIHFQTGDVQVELVRVGDRFVARGRLVVDPVEPAGMVRVNVTIEHGDSTAAISFLTEVLGSGDDDEEPEPTPRETQQDN